MGTWLAVLSNFFYEPWKKPATNLKDSDIAVILNNAGAGLRALGRLREAAQPMQAGMEMRIKQEAWKNAAIAAGNLSELYLTLGKVEAAVSSARQGVEYADKSKSLSERRDNRTTLADALHQAGNISQAHEFFAKGEELQKEKQPSYIYLYSLRGFQFCDLLLSQGKVREVLERAKQTLEWVTQGGWLLDIALDKLSLGRAYLLQAMDKMDSTSEVESIFLKAVDYLNQAVVGLRESGDQDVLPLSLFARAFFYRIQHQFPQAWDDLDEARELAERGDMKLYLVDYQLEAARLVCGQLSVDSDQSAVSSQQSSVGSFRVIVDGREVRLNRGEMIDWLKQHVEQAADLVQKTSYHRRDPEVELGYVLAQK